MSYNVGNAGIVGIATAIAGVTAMVTVVLHCKNSFAITTKMC